MSTNVGTINTTLTLDVVRFIAGLGKADRVFGTTMESFRKNANTGTASLERMVRAFGGTGIANASRVLGSLNEQAGALPGLLRLSAVAAGGFGTALGAGGFVRAVDNFNSLQNQLKSLPAGLGSAGAQFEALLGVAERSRSSIESVVVLFSRLAKADPNAEFGKTARAVETISKALQLGGATAQEAASAAVQFSQAIASNRLGGDELRAVLESPLGGALAKGIGVSIGKLRELSVAGKLTSDVVLAGLQRIGPEVDAQFDKSTKTIAQSFTVLQNRLVAAVGKFDQSFGASRLIGDSITGLANNLDKVTVAAEAAGVALAAVTVGRIAGGGVAALGSSLRSLGTDAAAGVAQATGQLGVLEDAFKKALAERRKLTSFQGPLNAKGVAGFDTALQLNNKRIAELTGILPQARTQLAAAQRAASGFGLAMSGLRGVGGSLVAFLGGPWGAAFAAAAAGATLIGARLAAASEQAKQFREVSDRLLGSVTEKNKAASDIIETQKYSADLESLRKDAGTARAELLRLLQPITVIGAEVDELRRTSGEFQLFPGAVHTVTFLQEQIDKLAKGGSLRDFNAALTLFQQRYQLPPAAQGLFAEIIDQAAQSTTAIETLSVATDKLNEKLAKKPTLQGFQGRDQAVADGLAALKKDADARAQVNAAVFAGRVADARSREIKLADSLRAAIQQSGGVVDAALNRFINGIARQQTLIEKINVAGLASHAPFEIKKDPHHIYAPGRGPDAGLEQGNRGIALANMLAQDAQRRDLMDQLAAHRATIANSGSGLDALFGDKAKLPAVKSELSGVQGEIQKIFDAFTQGKMKPEEAATEIEKLRQKLLDLGADPDALAPFMQSVESAISGVPILKADIDQLSRSMRQLATAARSVIMPDGSKVIRPPSSQSSSGGLSGGGVRGFAGGGMFRVGGAGGTDSQPVQFMASPNETVAVFTPSQLKAIGARFEAAPASSGGNVTVNAPITVNTNGTEISALAKRQIQMDLANAIQAATNRTR